MNFRTEISIEPLPWRIDHHARMLALGSCFADRIGARLLENKFRVQINPAGIAYNPISLARLLRLARTEDPEAASDIFLHQGRWHSFHFHSSLSDPDPVRVQENIGLSIAMMHRMIKQSNVLILTLGTAFGFLHLDSAEVVNNCHKVNAGAFRKELLGLETMEAALSTEFHELKKINPDLKILLTVSPVRHTKEGLADNQLSKSLLRVLCDKLQRGNENISYFPAYEIMVDDLRDYRFYGNDLIHPTEFAESYIWEKFAAAAFPKETQILIGEWQKVRKAMEHKPFNPQGEGYRRHLESLLEKMEELNMLLDVQEEMEQVEAALSRIY